MAEPPSREEFVNPELVYPEIKDKWEARSLMLTDYAQRQTSQVLECNIRIERLNEWVEEQSKGVEAVYDSRRGAD